MFENVEIVKVDDEHVQASVKTRTQVREVKDYAREHNIKYYRGVVASGRTYNENGDCTQEWYENPDYVAPVEEVELEPETVEEVDTPLEEEPVVEPEPEPEIDYKAMFESTTSELETARAEIAARDEQIHSLTDQVAEMEKTSDADDEQFAKLQEEYDDLCDALHLIGKHMHD